MSALRLLGISYFAIMSAFALAIATADQTQLRQAMNAATETVSDAVAQSIVQPLLAIAHAEDEVFFDPPPGSKSIALAPPERDEAFAVVPVKPVRQTRLVDVSRAPLTPELMIAPDLSEIAAPGSREIPALPDVPATIPALVQARLEQSLTPELRDNFDLFLFVSTAARGPAAQRLYVFKKSPGGNLSLLYDWAASTGREKYETSPTGQRAFTETPAGFYQFDPNRMYRQYRSRAWDGAMPYAMFLNWEHGGIPTGVAVHATTRSTIGRLGRRASAGCIHISAENAALLYEMIRSNYRGQVPRFAYDERNDAMSNRGDLMRDASGKVEMTDGFRVLIDIEKFSGRDVMAALD